MSLFSHEAAAALQRQSVQAAIGVAFHFDGGVQYYLRASEPRKDPRGVVWKAGPTVVNIDGLRFGIGRRTQPVTLSLAGLSAQSLNDEIARAVVTGDGRTFFELASDQADEVRGREIEFSLHQFDELWDYIETPTSLGVYVMDRLTPVLDAQNQIAQVRLVCEPLGSQKFRAANSYLDTRDQQRRHPGDKALDIMGKYVVKRTLPPW